MKIKRITSMAVAICMILSMLVFPVHAAEECLSANKTSLKQGEAFTLQYVIPNSVSGVDAITIEIGFDKDKFEVTSINYADISPLVKDTGYTVAQANTNGKFRGEWSSNDDTFETATTAANLQLFEASFTVKEAAAAGDADFTVNILEIADEVASDLTASAGATKTKATVNIVAVLTGDLPISITKPAKGGTPEASVSGTGYTGTITWEPAVSSGSTFAANTAYTASVTLNAASGYQFTSEVNPTVAGASVSEKNVADDGSTLKFKVTFPVTAGADALSGTVSITGTAKFGETLTANTVSLSYGSETAGILSYQWYRGDTAIDGATNSTYTLTADDVGQTIKVRVTADSNSGYVDSAPTAAVAKAAFSGTVNAPSVDSRTDTQVTANKETGYEYGVTLKSETNEPASWTMTGIIGNLTPNTEYKLWGRVAATDTMEASIAKSVDFITNKAAADGELQNTLKGAVTAYNAPYDGAAHDAFTVGSLPSGWSAQYADSESGSYSTTMPQVTNVSDSKTLWVKFSNSNYSDFVTSYSVSVTAKNISGASIMLNTVPTYDGTEKQVTISSVTVDGLTVTTSDYDISAGTDKAINVENTILKITGKGNYTGEASTSWTLQQATPTTSDFTISADLTKDYTGNPISVTAPTSSKTGIGACTVYYEGTGSTTYTKSTTAPTNAGSYTVTFDVAEGQNYKEATGLSIGTLTISTIDVSTLTATAPNQTAVAGVGNFNDPTITGVNSESVAGTFTYGYASETSKSHDDVVDMLKAKSADEEVTLRYTFTPSNSNYTGTKAGSFKVTVKDIEFKVSGAAASADNAINSLTDDTVYGKSWNERISVKSDSITASVGGTTKTGTYTIVPESGALADRPSAGTKSYTVKFTSTDGTYSDVTVFTGSITVTAKPVTITGLSVDNKVYDGSTTATVNGTAVVSGKVGSDDVTVTAGTAAFDGKNVGNGKIVTFSGYSLSGADAANYSLSGQPASVTANITAKPVTVTVTATDRDYVFGNRNVVLVAGSVTGAIGSDTVNVDVSGATGTMENENAGTDKTVIVTGAALSGTDAGNYNLTAQPTGVTVTINQIDPAAPTGLTGLKDKALSTVTLPAGWTWDNPSTTMNTTGVHTFEANYAGSVNYKAKSNVNVTVTVSDKESVTISGLTAAAGLTYNGSAQTGYTGTPSYSPAWTGTPVVTYYLNDGTTKTTTANSGASGEGLAPKNAGNYMVTIAIPDSDPAYTGNVTLNFTIAKRTISVKADNKSMTVNGTLPTFTVSYGNFASGDSEATVIETKATASCAATGTSTGSFPITVSGTTTLKSGMGTNYEVGTPESGTLTVNPRSSSGGGGGSSVSTYSVTVGKTENGTVSVSPKSAAKGDTVTITATPDKGYVLETLTVLDKNDKEIKITEKNGKYTFTMPASKVTVKATFMDDNTMLNYFVDVKPGDYFYDAVLWAVQEGITAGTDVAHFSPNAACTRAQIVTFLWRAAGSPEPKSMGSFVDVSADSYCAKAVAWAVENGITGGTGDGKFSPNATCTRAQAMTFLWRASGSPAVSGGSAFSDVAANAYYADAVAWAEKNEITGGIGGGLFGSGNNCTRGQIVTFLYRAFNK